MCRSPWPTRAATCGSVSSCGPTSAPGHHRRAWSAAAHLFAGGQLVGGATPGRSASVLRRGPSSIGLDARPTAHRPDPRTGHRSAGDSTAAPSSAASAVAVRFTRDHYGEVLIDVRGTPAGRWLQGVDLWWDLQMGDQPGVPTPSIGRVIRRWMAWPTVVEGAFILDCQANSGTCAARRRGASTGSQRRGRRAVGLRVPAERPRPGVDCARPRRGLARRSRLAAPTPPTRWRSCRWEVARRSRPAAGHRRPVHRAARARPDGAREPCPGLVSGSPSCGGGDGLGPYLLGRRLRACRWSRRRRPW